MQGIAFEGDVGPASASAEVNPTGASASAETTVGNPSGNHLGLGVSFSATTSSEVETSADGQTVTATSTGQVSFSAEASAQLGRFGVGAGVEFSTTQTQTVRVPAEAWGPIESGEVPYPNQYEPFSIPEGGTVIVNSEDARGTELEASYGGFKLSSGVEETEGVSIMVERVDENVVRFTSGPTATVEATAALGFDAGPVSASAEISRTLEDAQLTTVEFDLSTEAGRQAYDAYLATGELPPRGTTGVNDFSQTHRLTYEETVDAGLSIFGLDLDFGGEGRQSEAVLTEHRDGSRDQTLTLTGQDFTATAEAHFERGEEVAAALDAYDPTSGEPFPYAYPDVNWLTVATADEPDQAAQAVTQIVAFDGANALVEELINIVQDTGAPPPFAHEVG